MRPLGLASLLAAQRHTTDHITKVMMTVLIES